MAVAQQIDQAAIPGLRLRDIHKSFGGASALRGVSLDFHPGRIHALIGENGAGKSTLINIATGILQPDRGELLLGGQPTHFSDTHAAAGAGVMAVFQEADLFAHLSVAENMLLGQGLVRRRGGLIDWPGTFRTAGEQVATLAEAIDVRAPAGSVGIGRRVLATIAAAAARSPRVLFLDEPTASLTRTETRRLFGRLRTLRDRGMAIVFVSHRLEEVVELCDMLSVLRDGEHIVTGPVADFGVDEMVAQMAGRAVQSFYSRQHVPQPGPPVLEISDLSATDGSFRQIGFTVGRGEIVGLYGLVGAGRTELAQGLFGVRTARGQVRLDGQDVTIRNPAGAVRHGLVYLPEDRLNEAIFASHPCRENATAAVLPRLSLMGWIRSRRERETTQSVLETFRVKLSSPEQAINTLSGGNQQKIVFGRWWATGPRVLILDEPTRGVDVAAKAQIHQTIDELAGQGKAIVLISSELSEVMRMSDRVLVMSAGRLTGCFDPRVATEDELVAAAIPRRSVSGEPSGAQAREGGSGATRLLSLLLRVREAGLAAAMLLMVLLLAALRPAEFATWGNLLDVLAAAAILSVGAAGMTLVIITGGIDIAVGSALGLVGAAAGMLAIRGWPPLACLGAALALGAGVGLLNASLCALGRVHPIIITLAGVSIYRGAMIKLTGGYEVSPLPPAYRALTDGVLFGMPKVIWLALAVLALNWLFLSHTVWGRRVLAVGNSVKAARLIGISPTRQRLVAFAILGALLGLASVMWGGYYGKIQSNTGGGWELKVIAAAVIGGCSILGGRGTALGAFLGAVLIALIYNALVLLDISSYWQDCFIGLLILAVVGFDLWLPRLTKMLTRGRASA